MAELIVFYSLTGKSRQVAEWLAAGLNAEIEEIVEERPRKFALRGIVRSGLDSLFRRQPPIRSTAQREEFFDRVILACPVWGGRMAGPARTWLYQHGRRVKSLGLALHSGDGSAHPGVISEFQDVIGRSPKPLLTVSEHDFRNRAIERKIGDFIRSITIEVAKFPEG